jgi:hypothetical protein
VQVKVNDHIELLVTGLEEGVLDVLEDHIDGLVLIGDVPEPVLVGVELTGDLSPRDWWSEFDLIESWFAALGDD